MKICYHERNCGGLGIAMDPAEMLAQYDAYCLLLEGENGERLDNCDLSRITEPMASYILAAKEPLSVSKFSRIRDVARWLAENEL